jgi:hypothetical protein
MDGTPEIARASAAIRKVTPRSLRANAFLSVLVVGLLLGVGLRFVPTDATAAPAPGTAGQGAAASTACAAS